MSFGQKMRYVKSDLKYIPDYERWLFSGARDFAAHLEILHRIYDRPKRVRINTFSASGAGQCLRRRQLAYLGYEQEKPQPKLMNIFVNGDFVHLRHQIAGIMMGYFVDAEVSVRNNDLRLTGTMDADGSDGEIGEIKSINSNGFRQVASFGVKHEHAEQVHSYMLCSGRDEARVLYENKDTNDLKEFVVKKSSSTMQKVKDDLEILNVATEDKVLLPPLPGAFEKKGECRGCPLNQVCLGASFESQLPTPPPLQSIKVRRSTPADS